MPIDGEQQEFPIPDPPPVAPNPTTAAAEVSEVSAAYELVAHDSGTLSATDAHTEWWMRFQLRNLFFVFALGLNIWWDIDVSRMVWHSGTANSGFHLSDKVLIALLTTSIANFLGLLTIIANYLFHLEAAAKKQQRG